MDKQIRLAILMQGSSPSMPVHQGNARKSQSKPFLRMAFYLYYLPCKNYSARELTHLREFYHAKLLIRRFERFFVEKSL